MSNTQLAHLEDTELDAVKLLRDTVASGRPRTLTVRPLSKPWILFTDGALEYEDNLQGSGTIGAVLISPNGHVVVFGGRVPESLMNRWRESGKTHVIGLIELYAAVVAICKWFHALNEENVDDFRGQLRSAGLFD